MAEREAEGTVVVGRGRDLIATGHRKGTDSQRPLQRKKVRVVVPGAENCLEEDRENAQECGYPARSPATRPDPQPRGEAQTHAYLAPHFPCPCDPWWRLRSEVAFDTI
jgi:hypothetical protein